MHKQLLLSRLKHNSPKNVLTWLKVNYIKNNLALFYEALDNCRSSFNMMVFKAVIHLVVARGDKAAISKMTKILQPQDVKNILNHKNPENEAPLHLALKRKPVSKEFVSLLVAHGARLDLPDASGKTALHIAILNADVAIADVIIDEMIKQGIFLSRGGEELALRRAGDVFKPL